MPREMTKGERALKVIVDEHADHKECTEECISRKQEMPFRFLSNAIAARALGLLPPEGFFNAFLWIYRAGIIVGREEAMEEMLKVEKEVGDVH